MPTLTAQRLEAIAGGVIFDRGIDYVRYVRGLRVVGERATGSIQARNVYEVELDWAGGHLGGDCTCPHFAGGSFCKHLVAVGLCVIDGGHMPDVAAGEAEAEGTDDGLVGLIADLSKGELHQILLELARRDESVRRELELRHAVSSGDSGFIADDLVALVGETLSSRGFIDYRRSFEVARDAEEMLDELERCIDVGAADAAAPALLKAVTRLQKLAGTADDSGGVIGGACQRAADLYARACREGSPDGVKLAKWLARFRDQSPGWPNVELADFVDAFDGKALDAYRRAVAVVDKKHPSEGERWGRFEVDRMLLELADHDGDVDRAVEILSGGDHPSYGAILMRLDAAGRTDDAVTWIDRAVAAGRVTSRMGGGGNEYWLDPVETAARYQAIGRFDDGLAVLEEDFARNAGWRTFRALMEYAAAEDRERAVRAWAFGVLREQATAPFGSGAVLVEIALAERDLDAAWAAASSFGAGHLWEKLATASAESRPLDAANLYLPGLEKDLTHANTRLYGDIAKRLATMQTLHARAGESKAFDDYLREIREKYARRSSLMAALDRAGLKSGG